MENGSSRALFRLIFNIVIIILSNHGATWSAGNHFSKIESFFGMQVQNERVEETVQREELDNPGWPPFATTFSTKKSFFKYNVFDFSNILKNLCTTLHSECFV